jgi:serine/threonine protein kinase
LTDFGIARNLGDISGLTATNMTVGTLAFSAPEQLMGDHMDGRADQYSLAATAYFLLTGAQLFPHSNPAAVISRHLSVAPPLLSATKPALVALDPVLAQALAKDPGERFAGCSDFAEAFAHAAASGADTRPASLAATQARTAARAEAAPTAPASVGGSRKRCRFSKSVADDGASTCRVAEFSSKWRTGFSHLRGGSYNRTVVHIRFLPFPEGKQNGRPPGRPHLERFIMTDTSRSPIAPA